MTYQALGTALADLNRSHLVAWRYGMSHFGYKGDPPKPRGLLVGEAPGPNTDARLPLFPEPTNSAAGRLLRYTDVHPMVWMGKLVRMNLCVDAWADRRAIGGRVRAVSWLLDPKNFFEGEPLRVLLLGARVARTWSCYGPFGFVEDEYHDGPTLRVAWIPHPSGRNLLYNERKNQLRARRAVLWALGDRDKP